MARQVYNDTWASGGDKVDPGGVKTTLGWIVEAPPHEFFNFWQGQTDEMLQHLERNGISVFDATTIYELGGYAREGTVVFRSLISSNTGNTPSSSPTEWVQAFFKIDEAAGLAVANVFTEDQEIKKVAANSELILDADTGFDTILTFQENNVTRGQIVYDESDDEVSIVKLDTNGTTIQAQMDFANDGDVDVTTGILKVASNEVMHKGNDGPGSGFDSDTVDGIEGAALAQLAVANTFTQDQTIRNSAADTDLIVGGDTGFDSTLNFEENAVRRASTTYDESDDELSIIKFNTNGTTIQAQMDFANDGDIDVTTGTLKVAGNEVFHTGNDGPGSGLDADTVDGVEAAAIAQLAVANTFTEGQIIRTAGALSFLTIDANTGFDTSLRFQENSISRGQIFYDESVDILRILKFDTNGTTQKINLQFKNDGDLNLATGVLQVAGLNVIDTGDTASTTVAGIVERATDAEASAGTDTTRYVSPKQVADKVAASGGANTSLSNLSATGKDKIAKAWVNYDGSGVITIRDDFNVSSVTDVSTGRTTVNLTTAMANTNYCSVAGCSNDAVTTAKNAKAVNTSTSAINMDTENYGGTSQDTDRVYLAIFGDQ